MTADTTHYPELAGIVAGVAIAGHLVCRRLRRKTATVVEQAVVVAVIRDSYRDACAEQGCPICADGPEDAA